MNVTNTIISMSLVGGCFLAGANLRAQMPVPQIQCTVKNCLNPAATDAKPAVCDIANGEPIEIRIVLNTFIFNPLTGPALNPNPIPPNGEYFLLKVIRNSDNAEMNVKINKTGGGKNLNLFAAQMYLEIPESKDIRHAKALAAWNKVKTQNIDVSHWRAKDGDMADALEQDLVENQLGRYRITCSYVSSKPGTWNGRVSSPLIEINVVKTGTSLDKITKP